VNGPWGNLSLEPRNNSNLEPLILRAGFLTAWKSGKYKGEHFDFESPAALFRILTPKRWELIECLQNSGPLGVRALRVPWVAT
jgi:hypothetical protein